VARNEGVKSTKTCSKRAKKSVGVEKDYPEKGQGTSKKGVLIVKTGWPSDRAERVGGGKRSSQRTWRKGENCDETDLNSSRGRRNDNVVLAGNCALKET